MSWDKLKRTAVREFKRSPGKTCVLLALLPLALYFVGPLVWKKAVSSKAGSNQLISSLEASTGKASDKAEGTTTDWHLLTEQMASDSRTRTVPAIGLRNPFQLPETFVEIIDEKPEAEKKAAGGELARQDEVNPAELGMRLTSTIVGNHIRMATINGRPYRENAQIPFPGSAESRNDSTSPAAAENSFLLKTVARKFVVLEHRGKTYQLELNH